MCPSVISHESTCVTGFHITFSRRWTFFAWLSAKSDGLNNNSRRKRYRIIDPVLGQESCRTTGARGAWRCAVVYKAPTRDRRLSSDSERTPAVHIFALQLCMVNPANT